MPDWIQRRVVVHFDVNAYHLWQTLVDGSEVKLGASVLESKAHIRGVTTPAAARASTPGVGRLNDISHRSIRELHTLACRYKTDEEVCFSASSFRTSVVWGVLLCSLHRLKVMVPRSNLESPALSVYQSLIMCQHTFRFSGCPVGGWQ
jgi:hypothetical protein